MAIALLDELVINQIAAGEVIENTSSVVKELVDNALDANSSLITIEIEEGGRRLIRISDNGSGMDADDALLCFKRHATSKIRTAEDLLSIGTMGFRGEALPSIASIAKCQLITNTQSGKGVLLILEGGKLLTVADAVRDPGTTVEVRDLFYNVPVRQKFQRSPAYDARQIREKLSGIALANPKTSFKLIHNKQLIFHTRICSDQKERIAETLGAEIAEKLIPIAKTDRISGFVASPSHHMPNRKQQFLLINGRPIFSGLISYWVKEAYGTALAQNRHPPFVLYLKLPGDMVDVNVHPQKREVRFRDQESLREQIFQAVRGTLQKPSNEYIKSPSFFTMEVKPSPYAFIDESEQSACTRTLKPTAELPIEPHTQFPTRSPGHIAVPYVLATLPGYILIEKPEGAAVVHQQRAHARILFEKLAKPTVSEALLIPHTFDTSPDQAEAICAYIDLLKKASIEIEPLKPGSFIVHALPAHFQHVDVASLIEDLVHLIETYRSDLSGNFHLHLAQIAAYRSVSCKQKLAVKEASVLMQDLMQCKSPWICPKGRTTISNFTPEIIAQWFL